MTKKYTHVFFFFSYVTSGLKRTVKKKGLFEEKKCPAGLLYGMGKYDCLRHTDGSRSMASSPLSNTVEVGPAHMPCGQKVTEKDCKD